MRREGKHRTHLRRERPEGCYGEASEEEEEIGARDTHVSRGVRVKLHWQWRCGLSCWATRRLGLICSSPLLNFSVSFGVAGYYRLLLGDYKPASHGQCQEQSWGCTVNYGA